MNGRKIYLKRQNRLREGVDGKPNDIQKIIETYQFRKEEDRYSKRVSMERIAEEGYNLNISRYISTTVEEDAFFIVFGRIDEEHVIRLLALLQHEDADRDAGRIEKVRR